MKMNMTPKMNNLSEVLLEVCKTEQYGMDLRPNVQNLSNVMVKATEELGELSAEILKLNGFKISDEDPSKILEHAKEEAVDNMMMSMVIAHHLGMTEEELCERFKTKIDVWKKKHLNPENQKS